MHLVIFSLNDLCSVVPAADFQTCYYTDTRYLMFLTGLLTFNIKMKFHLGRVMKIDQFDCVNSTVCQAYDKETEVYALDSCVLDHLLKVHPMCIREVNAALQEKWFVCLWIWWNEAHSKFSSTSCLDNHVRGGAVDYGDVISTVKYRGC